MSRNRSYKALAISILTLVFSVFSSPATFAQHEHEGHAEATHSHGEAEEFNPGQTILHHVADEHQWHLATIGESHLAIPLPVILYTPTRGVHVYSSKEFYHGSGEHDGFTLHHEHFTSEDESTVYDFSITKNVASLIISVILLITIFFAVRNGYAKRQGKAPKGIQSAMEPFVIFIRDEVAKNYIGEKHYRRFLPYLLTVFFFIWINNLLGLLPGAANVTGNIAVTLTLAVLTFIIVNFNGRKTYWTHIFAMPGVPKWMLIVMTPVEIVGMMMKPFSLMVRLFANVTAGHIILLSLLSLIFIFKSAALSVIVGPFTVFMTMIELLVAVLQAYIFTVLTASYIGAAVEEHHHDDHH
ncbi:F0F1 ATP synthase subunit A [Siphonobacter sp. SORGH_AS_0500]|uniref:F0F1 ATP synthase subunit A n=1 Tax=Siphonobacter sp. SORGH_AS_0500 TaxID=1864824 RepID=UPI0028613C21|nr:F0F1 ATP synthase subunit A [Siphonobacter sp. SORGH_AS_0500]MDR6197057.1 F-type H+-transporting ATPase subunit a [Siphonobacter sp. SORGH_AS_0500]